VLASLDEIEGVRESRIDHGGRHFLFVLEPGVDPALVEEKARALLPDAHRPDARAEGEFVAGFRRGDRWLASGETRELSREEAHILAERQAKESAELLGLDEARARKLAVVLDEETAAAFDRIHAAGGGLGPDARAEFRKGALRVVERSRAFLREEEVSKLRAHLESVLGD